MILGVPTLLLLQPDGYHSMMLASTFSPITPTTACVAPVYAA